MKVVVVDDNASVLLLMQVAIQRKGHTVLTFRNPLDCPIYEVPSCPCPVSNPCPDIIISDFNMPGVNGIDFLEAVVKRGCRCVYHAIITAKELDEQALGRINKMGCRLFSKPLPLSHLYAWLDEVQKKLPATPDPR